MNRIIKTAVSMVLCVLMVMSCLNTAVFTGLETVFTQIAEAAAAGPVPGDINGDGAVNNKDLTRLMKYLAGEDVEVVTTCLDTNGDSNINNKDLTRLMKYLSGEDVEIYPVGCIHELESVEAKEATCTKEGNIAYCQCALCGEFFTDENGINNVDADVVIIPVNEKNHTVVKDPYVAPTTTASGLEEGSHCSECNEVLVPQKVIPPLTKEYSINYIPYQDNYQQKIDFSSQISDEVRSYNSATGMYDLPILKTEGYRFIGWFDGESSQATRVTEIPEGAKGNKTLFAHWEEVSYTITFASEFISVPAINDHKVNKATALPGADVMNMYGYRWLGWSDENGVLYDSVYPAGNADNITLHANWQSYRNQAVPVKDLAEPKIYVDEDTNSYIFTFKLGEIKNVPLYTINDFGKMIPGQPVVREEVTLTNSISSSEAEEIAKTVARATTQTSTWSLTNDWNKISSVSETHAEELGIDIEQINYDFSSNTKELSLTEEKGGSTQETTNWGVNAKIYGKNTTEVGAEAKFPVKVVNVGVSAKNTTEVGGELSAHYEKTKVNEAYWNTKASYNNSITDEHSTTTSHGLSQHISNEYNISTSTEVGGSQSTGESYETAESESNEYTSTVAYTTEEIKSTTYVTEYTTDTEGWWRQVEAGTIHVFGIVSYDMETSTYSVCTYNVLDSKTTNYMDFSKTSDDYNDYESGFIPFKIPYSVNEYISYSLGYTEDLSIDRETGIVDKYEGSAEHIHIPDYWTINNGDGTYTAIKVTGISEGAFKNKTSIKSVRLGKFITAIPNDAFSGCTSLESIEYEEITSIGENAFSGCTSLDTFTVDSSIIFLGKDAFKGVPEVIVYANNSDIVKVAVDSKIKKLSIYLKDLKNELKDTILKVPEDTESFILYGRGADKNIHCYSNLRIESAAAETVINGIKFIDNDRTPLELSSASVTLTQVSVEDAPGLAMILKADTVNLCLQDKNIFSTLGAAAVLTKGICLGKAPGTNTSTTLTLEKGKLLYCGEFTDNQGLLSGEKASISQESYEQLYNDALPWILASEVPEGAQIVSEKWTYDLRTDITSDVSEVEGYTLYDTTSSWGEYGSWSSWSRTAFTSGDNREVETKTVTDREGYTNYRYWIYRSSDHRTFGTKGYNGVCYEYAEINLSYPLNMIDSGNKLYGNYSTGCHSWCNRWFFGESRWVPAETHTEYRYRDRQLIYTYYLTKTENLESVEEVTETDKISNVRKWVQCVAE